MLQKLLNAGVAGISSTWATPAGICLTCNNISEQTIEVKISTFHASRFCSLVLPVSFLSSESPFPAGLPRLEDMIFAFGSENVVLLTQNNSQQYQTIGY